MILTAMVLLGIFIAICGALITCYFNKKSKEMYDDYWHQSNLISNLMAGAIIIEVLLGILALILGSIAIKSLTYNSKIELYNNELATIHHDVFQVVADIDTSVITEDDFNINDIYTDYPELTSNTIVLTEMYQYYDDISRLKELKEKQIDAQLAKWLLYFGGSLK